MTLDELWKKYGGKRVWTAHIRKWDNHRDPLDGTGYTNHKNCVGVCMDEGVPALLTDNSETSCAGDIYTDVQPVEGSYLSEGEAESVMNKLVIEYKATL